MRSWSYNRNLFNFQLLFILKYITIFLFPRDILSYTFFFNWMRYIILNKESLHKKTRSKKSCKHLGSTTKAYNTISNIWDGIFSIMMIAIFIIILGFLPRTTQKSNPQWIRIMLRLQLALSLIWYLIAGMKPWSLCYSLPKKSNLSSLSIPLGQPNTEDTLTWSFVQPGTYIHGQIWIQFPFKRRNYGWFLGIHPINMKCGIRYGVLLPYQTRLKVLTDDVCDHCKQLPEDMIHAVWSCPCISMVWGSDVWWNFRWTKFFQVC